MNEKFWFFFSSVPSANVSLWSFSSPNHSTLQRRRQRRWQRRRQRRLRSSLEGRSSKRRLEGIEGSAELPDRPVEEDGREHGGGGIRRVPPCVWRKIGAERYVHGSLRQHLGDVLYCVPGPVRVLCWAHHDPPSETGVSSAESLKGVSRKVVLVNRAANVTTSIVVQKNSSSKL